MCNCPDALPQRPGVFYCKRHGLFAAERLTLCILSEIEQGWEARLQQVPPIVRAMAAMEYAVDCTAIRLNLIERGVNNA